MSLTELIDSLIDLVDRRLQPTGDPPMDLEQAKTVFADRVRMTTQDILHWQIADLLQEKIKEEPAPKKNLVRVRMDRGRDRWVLLEDLEMKVGQDGSVRMQCGFGKATEHL